jgi:hypothetical protein
MLLRIRSEIPHGEERVFPAALALSGARLEP